MTRSHDKRTDVTRRRFLQTTAATTAAVAVSGLGFPHIAKAQPEKLIVPDAGGALRDAYIPTHYKGFAEKTGIEIQPAAYMGIAQIKALVENQAWGQADVVVTSASEAAIAGAQGLVEPIDYGLIDRPSIIPEAANEFWAMTLVAASLIAWNTDAMSRDEAPKTWAEFFDLPDPPVVEGPRGLWKNAALVMDMAALGDGVDPSSLYPLDVNRSINALTRIRDDLYWWEHGAQSAQMLVDNEVDFEFAWNGRVWTAAQQGGPVDYHFNQALLDGDAAVIPKGHPNKQWGMEFIAYMMTPEPQAGLAELIPYGPTNTKANALIPEATQNVLPTGPDNFPGTIFVDQSWWAENGQTAYDAFNEWLLG